MLSILIPTFNTNCVPLVQQLHQQCNLLKIPFEIRVYDDFSEDDVIKKENSTLVNLLGICYIELEKNLGRAKIRNKLAYDAKFDCLLFIDADMQVFRSNYIEKYLVEKNNYEVVFGGLKYYQIKENSLHSNLHSIYGLKREAISFSTRNKKPFASIKTCNLLIKKDVFESLTFNEDIVDYGYEDTLFGIELESYQKRVLHIDNPLVHTGIETDEDFLQKSQIACNTLAKLANQLESKEKIKQIRLYRYYLKLKYFRMLGVFRFGYKLFSENFENNLRSNNPNMIIFDLYKLYYLSLNLNS